MSGQSSCGNTNASSRMSLQSSQAMSLAKTLHVQDQIIEQLRADHSALRDALEVERSTLRECRLSSDRELKALQRENIQINKVVKQQEVKIEELEKALAFARETLVNEQKNLKSLEKDHVNTVKELKLKNSREYDKANKQEMLIDQLKSEIEDLKEALERERNATSLLIREHNAEVKMLREEVRTKSTEAYRELKERAIRERDEYREMQEEAEKTYKVLEKDFRDSLAAKDEEIRKIKAESRLIQKELEDQLRASLKEPTPHLSSPSLSHHDYLSSEKIRKLKSEVSILKEQNRKLLNELELLAEEDKMNEIKKEHYFLPFSFQLDGDDSKVGSETVKIDTQMEVLFNADKASRTEINRLLGEIRSKNRTINNMERELSISKQKLEKVCLLHEEEIARMKKKFGEATGKRSKPKLPIKLAKPTCENSESRRTHVKDIVRRLQERYKSESGSSFVVKARKVVPEDGSNSSQTLEDLKAIDEDIEKLRKQIVERDKIISALREAAEAKDKKLDQLMTEYSKLQMERAEPECRASLNGDSGARERNFTTFSTSPSPPLCNGELCWTDGFVNKNYHEPVYVQLLNDHTALQKIYNELREKLESKTREMEEDENQNFPKKRVTDENGINLIMAEQIRILKEREAQLMSEAEELREQNDLMEFRILELEECRKEEMINEHKHRSEKSIWSERDLEEVSDSGVMSLPTSEDLTSDSELGDTIKNYLQADNVIVPTLFPQIQISCNDLNSNEFKQKKILRNSECLQESGIFEDSEASEGNSLVGESNHNKACQTESILDKTLLDIINSSCDLILSKSKGCLADKQKTTKSDDLTTEISKLTEIQKRIQEKRENVCDSPKLGHQQQSSPCPHSNSIVFYEERLKQLEDKLKIYESSGDTKDVLLRKRLEKEIELSHRVKELTERVASLETINRQIEEERCEFEEAENDSRFQCQRLEVKVEELMEKNSELELELERQKMMMAGDRVDSGRRKNFKTKEKMLNTDNSMSMVEAAMPGIIAWNMFCLNQTKDEISEHLQSEAMLLDEKDPSEFCRSIAYPNGEVFQKLEELISDQKKLRVEYERAEEEAKLREADLKRKIEELEGKSARDRDILEEMTTYLKTLKGEDLVSQNTSTDSVSSTTDFEMFEELKRLAENEKKMKRKIDNLERKEQAYLQTLQQADEIWAGMEAEYKKKLTEAEDCGSKLRERVTELEEALGSKDLARRVDALKCESEELKGKVSNLANAELESRVKALENENVSLKSVIKSLSEELPLEKKKSESLAAELEAERKRHVMDNLTIEKLGKNLEEKSKNLEKVETELHSQISDLTQELAAKSKELSNLDVTVAELREEVETLENRVTELVGVIQSGRLGSAEGSVYSVQAMTDPRLGDSPQSASSLCDVMPDIPPMKIIRVKCEDLPEEVEVIAESACGVAKLNVPENLSSQLEGEIIPNVMVINETDDLPSPKMIGSSYSTRSESEVTMFMSEREMSSREIIFFTETELPVVIILIPEPEPKEPIQIHVLSLTRNPEIFFLKPEKSPEERVLIGYASQSVIADSREVVELLPVEQAIDETQTFEEDWTGNEDDLSELSLNNEALQKTVEKMEEEARLKDLEMIELQKTVSDIKREQQELELKLLDKTYLHPVESKATEIDLSLVVGNPSSDSNNDEDEFEDFESDCEDGSKAVELVENKMKKVKYLPESPVEKQGLDIYNLFSPFLVKPDQKMTPSMSNLQVALDNLQNKCRIKNAIFRALLEEFSDNMDLRCFDKTLSQIVPRTNALSEKNRLEMTRNGKEPYKYLSSRKSEDFPFTIPITVLRKVGSQGLYIEWDPSEQPSSVTGYEIFVNGALHHRVRSATRNMALLSNVNLNRKNMISLYPVSAKGPSDKCTSVTFPEEKPENRNFWI